MAILGQSEINTQQFGEGTIVVEKKQTNGDTRYIGGTWIKDNDWVLVISQIARQEHGWLVKARNTEIIIIATGCLVIFLAVVLISHTPVGHLEQTDREVNELNTQLIQQDKLDARGVTSGEAALDMLKEELYDVVLLDIKMPGGMDGIETLREIKRIQPLVEVLLLNGHTSVETSIEGIIQGAFDYLLKPTKLEDLLTKMAQAFEKKATHDKKIRNAKVQELIRYPSRVFGQEKE